MHNNCRNPTIEWVALVAGGPLEGAGAGGFVRLHSFRQRSLNFVRTFRAAFGRRAAAKRHDVALPARIVIAVLTS
jgi:hypothetical protein